MPVVDASGPARERVVAGALLPPAPRGGVREVLRQHYVLRLVVRRQLAQMYSASVLGLLWSYIQPVMRFMVYYFVIGQVLRIHDSVPNFALHLFTGMVAVHFFGETWSGGTRSIWANRALVKKMRMPREVFPMASAVTALYHTLPQVLVLVVACLLIGWAPTWLALGAGVLGMSILVLFSLAMGLFFSAVNVFARDFQNIVGTVMQFMHFLVPMIYPFSFIFEFRDTNRVVYEIYMANPVTQAVILLQRFFWEPTVDDISVMGQAFPPDMWERGLITLVICFALLVAAQKFFTRVSNTFPERL